MKEGLQAYLVPAVISLITRDWYGKNLSIVAWLQLRQEAAKAAYREGILEPYRAFEYQSSNSLGSAELGD